MPFRRGNQEEHEIHIVRELLPAEDFMHSLGHQRSTGLTSSLRNARVGLNEPGLKEYAIIMLSAILNDPIGKKRRVRKNNR